MRRCLLPLTGGGRLPLIFIVAGLVAFGLAAAWLARVAGRGSGFPPFLHPEVVAVAHLWLPGFLLSICLGATYQLMPVVLGEAVRLREGWLWTHAGLHLAGVVALVWGLASGRYLAAGLGGLAVVAGVAILSVATLRTFRASRRRDAAAWRCGEREPVGGWRRRFTSATRRWRSASDRRPRLARLSAVENCRSYR